MEEKETNDVAVSLGYGTLYRSNLKGDTRLFTSLSSLSSSSSNGLGCRRVLDISMRIDRALKTSLPELKEEEEEEMPSVAISRNRSSLSSLSSSSSSSSVETKGHVQNVNNVKKFSSSSSSNHSITTSIDMTTFLQTKEKDENDVLWLNQIDAMIESVICKCGDIDDMNLKVIQSGPSESRLEKMT